MQGEISRGITVVNKSTKISIKISCGKKNMNVLKIESEYDNILAILF